MSKGGAAVLETRETSHVQRTGSEFATARRAPKLRRDLSEDFRGMPDDAVEEPEYKSAGFDQRRRKGGVRLRLQGGMPKSILGRAVLGVALVTLLGVGALGVWTARRSILSDKRFAIPSSSSIQITGNNHLTRAQLLSVFGEDVDRNVLTISLAERKAELEQLPWVEHATVMRLLPNRIRVSIVERTPVAFFRQGGHVGLVDANGVLLDMDYEGGDGTDAAPAPKYSFPVVTGISSEEPLSTRAARMKIFLRFMTELNQSTDDITDKLSDVDLSSPEDVKTLISVGTNSVLVHFGDAHFLERYRKFQENLPKWKADYPKLASADMRYARQVVLEMQTGTAVPLTGTPEAVAEKPVVAKAPVAVKTQAVAAAKVPVKVAVKAKAPVKKVAVAHPATTATTKAKPAVVASHPVAPHAHLTTAFDVPSKKTVPTDSKTYYPQAGPR